MACSLPVVSTTAAGCASDMIIDGENGFIVEPRNAEALSQAIWHILQDERIQQNMGAKSYEILTERFNVVDAVNGFFGAI